MKKLLLIFAVMALLSAVFAQTYLFEPFETDFTGTPGAPPGWTQTMNRPVIHTTGERNWLRNTWTGSAWSTTSWGTNPTGAYSGTGVLWIDDYNFMGSFTPMASRRMESPVINLSNSVSPYLRFWYFNAQGPGITLNLRAVVSRDGGVSWDNLTPIVNGFTGANNTWNRISIAIPAYWRTANTRIGIEITNRWGSSNPFIDDVSVEEFTPTLIQSAGSGEWNAAATWAGGVIPTADNHVEILAGHTVTVTNAASVTGIIARCQRLVVRGTLNHGTGTANLLHAFGDIWVHGVFNAFNATSGRTVYCGGDFRIFSGGAADFSVGTTAQSVLSPIISITTAASQLVVLGAADAVFENGGTLVNGRINNFAMKKPYNFTLLQPVTVPFTFGLYSGNVLHTGGNLILGNAPATGTVQNIVYHHGGLGEVDPVWNNTNIASRSYTLFSPNWVPLTQTTVHSNGIHFELVGGVRTVTNTLTMNTHNNLLLNTPVTVGTATIGGFTLTRGIIDTGGHVLHLAQGNASAVIGTAPSTATPSTTHGSYVVGLLKRTFPATGTNTRQFPLGLGTAFNGWEPNANVSKHVTIATGTNGSLGQSPIVSIVGAPSGAANAPLTMPIGNFAYRVNRDGGPDFIDAATITIRGGNYTFGGGVHSDGLGGMIDQLIVAQSTALTGSWTARSNASGTNTPIVDNAIYERTTVAPSAPGPIAPLATHGEFFGWGTTAPMAPVFSITPNEVAHNFGQVMINTPVTRQYTITNAGGGTLDIQSIGITGNAFYEITTNPAPIGLGLGQSAILVVRYLPTAVGSHNAQLTITYSGGTHVIDYSGTCYDPTIRTFPHLESFDVLPFAPLGWTNIRTAGTASPGIWDRQTAGTNPTCSPYSGAGMARYNSFNITLGNRAELITPPINFPNSNYQVTFWMYRDTGYPTNADQVNVYYNTTNSSAGGTLLGTINRSTNLAPVVPAAGWYEYTFNMPAGAGGNGRFIVFEGVSAYGNDIHIDHVLIRAIPVGLPDPPTLVYPTDGLTGLPVSGFNIQWTPASTGGTPTSYNLYIADTDIDEAGGLYEQHVFPDIVGTSYNPVTQGGMTFNYLERWYWTVEAVNVVGTAVADPWEFVIEADPRLPLPYEHNFPTAAWPAGWTQTFSGGVTSNRWNVNNSSLAGGAPHEMRASWVSGTGISRLVTPPFNTTGLSAIQVRFRHFYDDYGAGVTARVMSSNNLNTWTPSGWQFISGGGNIGPVPVTITIPVTGNTTYIAWVLDGNHYQIDFWYVDEVNVSEQLANDVSVTAILGMPQSQLLNATYNPQARVANMGLNTQTFNVTMTIGGGYSSTQQVTGLASGQTALVDFAPWIPVTLGNYTVAVTTQLAGDQNPSNDSMTQPFRVWETLWVNEANIPVVSYLGSAASYIDGNGQGNIITSGGNTANYTEVQRYNAHTNSWTALTNIPAARRVHASAIVNGFLYIIGGSDGASVYHNTVYRYDIAGNTWTTMAPLPVSLAWIKAVGYNNTHIYVAGGVNAASVVVSTVYVYDIAANTWSVATPMPGPKFGGAFAITGNSLVYAAGADDLVISNVVYVGVINPLNPASINWTTSRATYPGVKTSYQPVGGPLAAMEASHVKDQFRPADYPAGGMYRFDGATWGDDAIIAAGGGPSAAWAPASPGRAYYYTPATDTWTDLPDLNVPVLGSYFSAVQSSPGTWKAVLASGYTGMVISPITQTYTMVTGVVTPDTPTNVTINTGPAPGQVTINWDHMPNATWYGVYGGTDPYNLVYLGYVTNNMVIFTAGNMGFFEITAGAGVPTAPALP